MQIEAEQLSVEFTTASFDLQLIRVRFSPRGREYTYLSAGDAEVGDLVEVPPNSFKSVPSVALVVGIGSNYNGPVVPIIRVVRKGGE